MSKGLIAIFGIIGVFVLTLIVFVIMGAVSYNGLVSQDINVKDAYAQIENRLLERHDKIEQLWDVVEDMVDHESDIYAAITSARTAYAATTPEDPSSELTAFFNFVAVAEDNIQITSNTLYIELMGSIEGMESALSVARRDYNEAIGDYENGVRSFPNVIFANMFGFKLTYDRLVITEDQSGVPSFGS